MRKDIYNKQYELARIKLNEAADIRVRNSMTRDAEMPSSQTTPSTDWSLAGHLALDLLGLVPVIGEPADLINAAWYTSKGDYTNAALSAASAIPIAGYAATAGKLGLKTADALSTAGRAVKATDTVSDTSRVGKVVDDSGRILPPQLPVGQRPLTGTPDTTARVLPATPTPVVPTRPSAPPARPKTVPPTPRPQPVPGKAPSAPVSPRPPTPGQTKIPVRVPPKPSALRSLGNTIVPSLAIGAGMGIGQGIATGTGTAGSGDGDDNRVSKGEEILDKRFTDRIMLDKLGIFDVGDPGAYTKSTVKVKNREENPFNPKWAIDPATAEILRSREQTYRQYTESYDENNFLKNRVKVAVNKYLKSPEGYKLNKHLETLKKNLYTE